LPPDQSALVLWRIDKSNGFLLAPDESRRVKSASVSDAGTVLVLYDDGAVQVLDGTTRKGVHQPDSLVGPFRAAALSPDGTRALCAGPRGSLFLWELARGTPQALEGHPGEINHVVFLPDGRRALSCGNDGTLWLSDLDKRSCRSLGGPGAPITDLSVSRDGKWAFTAVGKDGNYQVHRWELDAATPAPVLMDFFSADQLAASPDGSRVLYCRDEVTMNKLCFALVPTKDRVSWEGHDARMTAWAYARDGRIVLTGQEDGTVTAWDAENVDDVKQLRVFPKAHPGPVTTVAFSADGNCAVTASPKGGVRFWDLRRADRLAKLEAEVRQARPKLDQKPPNAAAVRVLQEWYASRAD
jgi:WD40 repeat protein